jgi:hypothetical protein
MSTAAAVAAGSSSGELGYQHCAAIIDCNVDVLCSDRFKYACVAVYHD